MGFRWQLECHYGLSLLQFSNLLKYRYWNILARKLNGLFFIVIICFTSRWRVYLSNFLLFTIFVYNKNFVLISNYDFSVFLEHGLPNLLLYVCFNYFACVQSVTPVQSFSKINLTKSLKNVSNAFSFVIFDPLVSNCRVVFT